MDNFFVLNHVNNEFNVEGDFAGYVIYYRKSTDIKVAEVQLNLLNKLIQNALKLTLSHFLFIDLNTQNIRLSVLRKTLDVNKCFLFGINESEIGINFNIPDYKIKTIAGIEFLKIDIPEKIEQDAKLKTQLWKQLQILFKIEK